MKTITLLLITALFFAVPVSAQDCPTVITEALAEAADCTTAGANEVCYGSGRIEATANCADAPAFDAPGDILPLDAFCSLHSQGMDSTGEWGLVVMRVTPHLSDQTLSVVVVGEVEMQNAATSLNAMDVRAERDLNILSGPGSSSEVLATLSSGEVLRAHACNCTGNWLRTVLEDGRVGWIPSTSVTVMGDASALPVVDRDTPVYAAMQAFTLRSGDQPRTCAEVPADGVLIQSDSAADPVPMKINGVAMTLAGTVFIQAQPGGAQIVHTLSGEASVTVSDLTAGIPAGMRAVIPMTDQHIAAGTLRVEPYAAGDVEALPLALLPETVDPPAALVDDVPHIIGMESCRVISNAGETICPIYFANRDGDAITRMEVHFVSAPQGEWTGSIRENPVLVEGNSVSGALSWGITCSTGKACFIGPVVWSITLTDAAGNVSEPFEASFNCVGGE